MRRLLFRESRHQHADWLNFNTNIFLQDLIYILFESDPAMTGSPGLVSISHPELPIF
jgi:hypothetical protein